MGLELAFKLIKKEKKKKQECKFLSLNKAAIHQGKSLQASPVQLILFSHLSQGLNELRYVPAGCFVNLMRMFVYKFHSAGLKMEGDFAFLRKQQGNWGKNKENVKQKHNPNLVQNRKRC